MRYCSVPDIGNFRKWFEKNFDKPCKVHDFYYETVKTPRYVADYKLALHMYKHVKNKDFLSRLFIYWPTILVTYCAVSIFGWSHWGKK